MRPGGSSGDPRVATGNPLRHGAAQRPTHGRCVCAWLRRCRPILPVTAVRSYALPPPIGGWDTSESISDMPENRALVLDNWFPGTDKLTIRRGYTPHVTNLPGRVETLFEYTTPSGREKLFAAANGQLFDVTRAGPAPTAEPIVRANGFRLDAFRSDRWQYATLSNSGGYHLIAVNGLNPPVRYDGVQWHETALSPIYTWVTLHHNRLWFGQADSLSAWYLGRGRYRWRAPRIPPRQRCPARLATRCHGILDTGFLRGNGQHCGFFHFRRRGADLQRNRSEQHRDVGAARRVSDRRADRPQVHDQSRPRSDPDDPFFALINHAVRGQGAVLGHRVVEADRARGEREQRPLFRSFRVAGGACTQNGRCCCSTFRKAIGAFTNMSSTL